MISSIIQYTQNTEVRSLIKYQNFLKAQKEYTDEQYNTLFNTEGYASKGIRVLRYILNKIDYAYMDKQLNNYDRYTYYVHDAISELMPMIDRSTREGCYRDLFFTNYTFTTDEYLLPILDTNTIINLPLYTDSWDEWVKVRPLYIWSHNSDELSLFLLNDTLRFKFAPPNYAVELLDISALILKYYIWTTKYKQYEEVVKGISITDPMLYFLHRYVLIDWVWDLVDIWLLRCFDKLFDTEKKNLTDFLSQNLEYDKRYGKITAQSYDGFVSVWNLFEDIKKLTSPNAFFSSNLLYSGSINDRVRNLNMNLDLPIQEQYEWLRWLRDKDLMKLYLKVYSLRPDNVICKRINASCKKKIKSYINQKIWKYCRNTIVRDTISSDITNMHTFLWG